jgi:hypothetical protein
MEVNGIEYERRVVKKTTNSKTIGMLTMLSMFGGMGGYGDKKARTRPVVNLEEEFALIQAKKSKLSRGDRDWVVATFHKQWKQVN